MKHAAIKRPADFVEFRREAIFQGIHERIEGQAALYPNRVALQSPDVMYTYDEMNRAANAVAAEVLSVAGQELGQVAILLPNEPDMIISLLGAMKAHKAHVPLDPNFPADRLRIMIEDAEPAVLITDDEHLTLAEQLSGKRIPIVNLSRVNRSVNVPNPGIPSNPMERAYILYTSGSTGKPKGMAFPHRTLLNGTMSLVNSLFFSPGDRVTWLHSASFAASVVDIYCCLTTGGTVFSWDVKTRGFTGLADWIRQERITTFQWIPSAFRQFLRTVPDDLVFDDVRIVVMASEPLTAREVELFRRHFPEDCRLVNQLGTSEAHNYRLYFIDHHTPIPATNVPGGYAPSQDREVLILDDDHKPLPAGSVGEIGIKSAFMCAGYWRDEALTKEKFIHDGPDEAPIYLTGDLGRLEPDGCLIHLGRKDSQVKIRGHRVELAEVEHVLAAAPGIAEGAVGVAKNRLDQDQLVAYVVLRNGVNLDRTAVETYIKTRLPDYMVPRHFTVLDRLPTLPTGKTDRKGLPNPFAGAAHQIEADGETPLVDPIVALFKELLQAKDVTEDASFTDGGGDSLLAAVLLQRIYERYDVRIAPRAFMESPTPRCLAALVKGAARGGRVTGAEAATRGTRAPIRTLRADHGSAQQDLIIIGAGGFAREVYSWASQAIAAGAPYRIKGFLDSRIDALAGLDYSTEVFHLESYAVGANDVFVGALGSPKDKIKCYTQIIQNGGRFVNLIHPLASVGKNVSLGAGIVVGPYSVLNADVTIGDHVAIGTFSNVGHDAVVGNWCHVASHCGVNGHATIGEAVFLGSHSCVIPGVRVGDNAFVGAGSIVVRNLAAGVRVFGNPAEIIGTA